jgi:hypothetical protein
VNERAGTRGVRGGREGVCLLDLSHAGRKKNRHQKHSGLAFIALLDDSDLLIASGECNDCISKPRG